jgi:hypothetical protein
MTRNSAPSVNEDPNSEGGIVITEVDADAKLHTPLGCEVRVLSLKSSLDIDRAVHRLDHAGELRNDAVAGLVDEASMMLLYLRID